MIDLIEQQFISLKKSCQNHQFVDLVEWLMNSLDEFWFSWELSQVCWIDWKSCSDVEDDSLESLKKWQCHQCSSRQRICENKESYSSCIEHIMRILDNSWELHWQSSNHDDWQWWIFHLNCLLVSYLLLSIWFSWVTDHVTFLLILFIL